MATKIVNIDGYDVSLTTTRPATGFQTSATVEVRGKTVELPVYPASQYKRDALQAAVAAAIAANRPRARAYDAPAAPTTCKPRGEFIRYTVPNGTATSDLFARYRADIQLTGGEVVTDPTIHIADTRKETVRVCIRSKVLRTGPITQVVKGHGLVKTGRAPKVA